MTFGQRVGAGTPPVGLRCCGVRRRRHGEPDPFDTGGFAVDERPASDEAAFAAVKRFAETFVMKRRRERVRGDLLHREAGRRNEAIQSVYKWIDPAMQSELEGNAGFPQRLHERFGDLRGVMIDGHGARHVTAAGAAVLAQQGFGAIFVADSISLALLFPETGHPTLCLTPGQRH
jgi:hypothetical protein